jgi:oligopeptide transport system substrate-binding protein
VEEIIRSLIDDGAIVQDEATGRWQATRDVADIPIPDTLHGVLIARIDRLQEETKRVLQMAAVIGRIFLYRVLAAIAREERDLDEQLLTLQREEMIRERARVPELEYIFKHHLTQEAAYNGLLKKERRIFHQQVAEALERLFPERIEEQVGLLAHHWERAEEPDKAIEYLSRAGDQARLAYAHQEAIDYYQRALAFLKEQGEHEQAARTLMKLGLTHHAAFDFQRSRQAYEEGFALWPRAWEMELPTPPPAPHPLRLLLGDSLRTLDPLGTSSAIVGHLFSGLVEPTPEMDVVPDVAWRWEVLDGGRKYVFHLRDDVRWSDGTPLTAHDFEYAWKRALDPATKSPMARQLYDIKGAEAFHQGKVSAPDSVGVSAVDEATLAVELEGPTGYFLHLLTSNVTCPVPRHTVEAHGEDWTAPEKIVTNGPFRLESWQRGERLVLARNETYHGRSQGNVEKVELLMSGDIWGIEDWDARSLALYETGTVDVLRIGEAVGQAREQYAEEHVSFPSLWTIYVSFDLSRPPFNDLRVRRAFALAIDSARYQREVTKGLFAPASGGFLPPEMPGHSPGIGLPYDPAQARRLLAEAGYPEGHQFPSVKGLGGTRQEADYLQAQWRENLGVEVEWEVLDVATAYETARRERPPLSFGAWGADYPDPDNFLRLCLQKPYFNWRNEAFDRLVEEARRLTDQEKRMKLYRQADRILMEEVPLTPLFYGRSHFLVKPWVRKYLMSPIGDVFWKDVIIEPH